MQENEMPAVIAKNPKTAAERKAGEAKRKAQKGLKRRHYWLSDAALKIIDDYRKANDLKSNDQALDQILLNGEKNGS